MKKILIVALTLSLILSLSIGISPVMAAKPQPVISMSNGFPSGPHFNLNLHGKKAGFVGDGEVGGKSVFILEYGVSTIEIVSNKKASLTELTVLDKLAEAFDGDPALVQLPHEAEGYYVFVRILGKPNNGKTDGEQSDILLYPNPIPRICNDDPLNPDPDFPTYTDPNEALLALGLVTTHGVYELTSAGLERFEPTATKGKGKSKAIDITGLFMWSGWVLDASLDTDGPEGVPDGVIDEYDVPTAYDELANGGNGNGIIDTFELENWLADQEALGLATYHDNEWIFNIADLVVQEQTVTNDGTKLLQIRFYPVATTEFLR